MSKFNWSNPPYKIKKDGTQSKVHDRSVYRTPGNEVELAYGTFTVLEAEKVDKIWYVTLKDVNETFKIKQQQMGNKKLPKTRVIIADTQPVIAGLLPAPKPVINKIIEEVEQITNKHFNSHNNPSEYYHSFKSAVAFIKRNRRFYRDKLPGYYRELSNCYHPDRCNTHLYQQPYTAEDYMSVIQTLR